MTVPSRLWALTAVDNSKGACVTAIDQTSRRLRTAQADISAPEDARVRAGLTRRELGILRLLASGMTAHQMGRACGISPRTVRKHLEHIYAKLEAHDRLLAVTIGRERGLL